MGHGQMGVLVAPPAVRGRPGQQRVEGRRRLRAEDEDSAGDNATECLLVHLFVRYRTVHRVHTRHLRARRATPSIIISPS